MTEESHLQARANVPGGHGWLYNHIGRLAGITLGLLAFFFVAFLTIAGLKSTLGLLIFVVVGVFVIAAGGYLRRS